MNSVITTDFNDKGEHPKTTKVLYFYDNKTHLQPTRVETTTSDGKTILTKTYYPDDIINLTSLLGSESLTTNEFNAIQQLNKNNSHRITEPIQVETSKNGHKTIHRTNYKTWTNNSLILPEFIQTAKGSTSLQNRINFKKYDTKGNPIEVSKTSDVIISYIWGYNKEYPIAKIENASNAEIASALGLSDVMEFQDLNETNLSSINTLRNNLPRAMVTTYTYDPLIGITSITDPRGYTMTYIYDNFNRLKEVRDQDNMLAIDYEYHYKN